MDGLGPGRSRQGGRESLYTDGLEGDPGLDHQTSDA